MTQSTFKEPERIYKSDTLHQRWLKAMEFLRTESKTGFLLDKQVEKIEIPQAVFFQGKLTKIVASADTK